MSVSIPSNQSAFRPIHSNQNHYEKVRNAQKRYAEERTSMSPQQISQMLNEGGFLASKTTLTKTLCEGGSAFFPHTFISKCGDQIAAVVTSLIDACEESGKKKIIILGVLHGASSDELEQAKKEELAGKDVSHHYLRGIIPYNDPRLGIEYSLDHFKFLLEHAIKERSLDLEAHFLFPNLVDGNPTSLPGIDELTDLAKDAIVVSTGDLCHHGAVFNSKNPIDISDEAYAFAKEKLEEGLLLLKEDNYAKYRDYCVTREVEALSDTKDVGQILRFLLGPLTYQIHDLRLVDLTQDYGKQGWVAASLIELKPVRT